MLNYLSGTLCDADGSSFLHLFSPDHPQVVLLAMETIMITVIDESEEVPMDLLDILLASVKKDSQVSFSYFKLIL